MSELPSGVCALCDKEADELCYDLACRECHVTCSWDDCISGAWVRRKRQEAGLSELNQPEKRKP